MVMQIPTGTTIRDRATGQPIGCTTSPVLITIKVDAGPLIAALEKARAQIQLTAAAAKQFMRALGDRRLETLRHQARLKGRPGWRSIRIPKGPRYRLTYTPNEAERSAMPFAHDDRIDAMPPPPATAPRTR